MTAVGPAKLQAVKELMGKLSDDLEKSTLSQSERDTALEQLKLYGRDPTNADPIFTQDGVKTLAKHAFEGKTRSGARGALRVLANSMLLKPATRQALISLDYQTAASAHLKSEGPKTWDDAFLLSRVLLLATYAPAIDISALLEDHGLADGIIANLARHTEVMSDPSHNRRADPMEDMALNETLRLLFNVSHHCPKQISLFSPAVPLVLALLFRQDISPSKPLDPPFSPLVNSLLNLDLKDPKVKSSLCPETPGSGGTQGSHRVAARLVQILDLSFKENVYPAAELEQLATPLVGVISDVYVAAADNVKQYLQTALLPKEQEREEILGRGASLGARLLRKSNDPLTPRLGDVVSHLLFDLSDRDPNKFTENVGFGYASGFLAKNNIPTPPNVGAGSSSAGGRAVNPVTGQFLDSERFPDVPEMTEDEKLREAERLFVLFERLKNTGIVDIQNPVEEAVRSGQFEEMDKNRVTELESDDEDSKK